MTNTNRAARAVMVASAGIFIALIVWITSSGSRNQLSAGGGTPAEYDSSNTAALAEVKFDRTPERLDRGKYLVEGVAHCFECHSDVDWKSPGAQPVAERKGAGHQWSDMGAPFLTAPNITPDVETGAGSWTDAMLVRAIREGIGHDGRRLFPMMPYMWFRHMSDEDVASVVVYLRSLKPVRNPLPKTELPEELKAALPPPMPLDGPVSKPDQTDPVKRGEYLAEIGSCSHCHTPFDEKTGRPIPGLDFAGGFVLKGPWGEVASANLTPDPSGIPYYDENLFIQTIRTGSVKARKLNSIMPWGYARNLTDKDLKDLFAYLRTLRPVKHVVDNTENPTYCDLCKARHGFGDRNRAPEDLP